MEKNTTSQGSVLDDKEMIFEYFMNNSFTHTFFRRLRKSSSGVGTIDWRLNIVVKRKSMATKED